MGRDLAKKLQLMPTPPDNDTSVAGLRTRRGAAAIEIGEPSSIRPTCNTKWHSTSPSSMQSTGTLLPAVRNPELEVPDAHGIAGAQAHLSSDEGSGRQDGRDVKQRSMWRVRSPRRSSHDINGSGSCPTAGRAQLTLRASLRAMRQGRRAAGTGHARGGAYVVLSGQLRVFTLSPDGHEATLYVIDPHETCVLALNCIFNDLLYPAWVEAGAAAGVAP